MANILFASQLVVKVTSSMFASNCLYCTLVEQPARMRIETKSAHAHWKAGFIQAAAIQSSLSLVGSASAMVAYYQVKDKRMLAIAGLLFSILPYTYLFMMETNTYLLDSKCNAESEQTRERLSYWGTTSSVRTVIGLAAMAIALYYY